MAHSSMEVPDRSAGNLRIREFTSLGTALNRNRSL